MLCLAEQLERLRAKQKQARNAALAPGTFKNISLHWRTFYAFCTFYGLVRLPASVETVGLYIQCLADSFESVASIKNYVSSIRTVHVFLQFPPPDFGSLEIVLALKGLYRLKGHVVRQAAPLTPEILNAFLNHLDLNDPLDATFWAMILVGFYMMLRKSNLMPDTVKGFDPQKQFTRKHVEVSRRVALFYITWSKTNQFSQRVLEVPLVATPGSRLCPVTALQNMVRLVPLDKAKPCFAHVSGRAITYPEFQEKLKHLIACIGRDPKLYSSHSMRHGGATWAFQAGIPATLIQVQGDWSPNSLCYLNYLKFPIETRAMVGAKMGAQIREMGI